MLAFVIACSTDVGIDSSNQKIILDKKREILRSRKETQTIGALQ